ncbi:MAG: FkbM family methyltransferase [Rhizobiales bacterium]|nr:FkbM family methyltransferase [Hyphomicrobiales bacterium]
MAENVSMWRSDDDHRGVMLPPDGETGLVREFFQSHRGYFVDVGANDPTHWSQTFHLEQVGWNGVLIEPQPQLAEALRARSKARVYAVACSSPENSGRTMPLKLAGPYSTLNRLPRVAGATIAGSIDVPIKTLDEVLANAGAPSPIDFISIDVEGHEREVLRGLDLDRWRPRLILIEDHVLHRHLHNDLVSRGYIWTRRTGLNSWYVSAGSKPALNFGGRLRFFRKYYLGVPFRRLRDVVRRCRQ